jgi:hypothetical protein
MGGYRKTESAALSLSAGTAGSAEAEEMQRRRTLEMDFA